MNQSFEGGVNLTPVGGPGFIGLKNLGNTQVFNTSIVSYRKMRLVWAIMQIVLVVQVIVGFVWNWTWNGQKAFIQYAYISVDEAIAFAAVKKERHDRREQIKALRKIQLEKQEKDLKEKEKENDKQQEKQKDQENNKSSSQQQSTDSTNPDSLLDSLINGEDINDDSNADDEEDDDEGLSPKMFRSVYCGQHPEFSTMEQQDAFDFLLYMLDKIRHDEDILRLEYIKQQKQQVNQQQVSQQQQQRKSQSPGRVNSDISPPPLEQVPVQPISDSSNTSIQKENNNKKNELNPFDPTQLFRFVLKRKFKCLNCQKEKEVPSDTLFFVVHLDLSKEQTDQMVALQVQRDFEAAQRKEKIRREKEGLPPLVDESQLQQQQQQTSLQTPSTTSTTTSTTASTSTNPIKLNLTDQLAPCFGAEVIDVRCDTCNSQQALSTHSLAQIPDMLIIKINRTVLVNGMPRKLEVPVVVPLDDLDLGKYVDQQGISEEQQKEKEKENQNQTIQNTTSSPQQSSSSATSTSTETIDNLIHPPHTSSSSSSDQNSQNPNPDLNPNPADIASQQAMEQQIVDNLVPMGFSENRARRAFREGKKTVDDALDWIVANLDNASHDLPLDGNNNNNNNNNQSNQENSIKTLAEVPQHIINSIMEMGFTHVQAVNAVKKKGANIEEAVTWITSNFEESFDLNENDSFQQQSGVGFSTSGNIRVSAGAAPSVASDLLPPDGSCPDFAEMISRNRQIPGAKYHLVGFINHRGMSVQSGHYLCFVRHYDRNNPGGDGKAGGQWIVYNDRHVSIAKEVSTEQAYILFYRRTI
ncbi:MAG: putative Ubiquitin carboxyl-terminal hydrolase 5 [Streblomastix strix]|uniref:Putative Ubiquitin carboxyl-terminal hydrolase 5 n=1 Tax=Streblomastix strix TaxID=222440 RepID=A0A5J4WLY9_9EUKA|nr:MAG: putative Ubiquitin carboxyl-terminal hydrolase 5 [Streblomastix strix]